MSFFRHLLPTLGAALLSAGLLVGADPAPDQGPGAPGATAADTDVQATVTGTVTEVSEAGDPHPSFSLRPDGGGDAALYRPYYRGGHADAMADRIRGLHVGDHLTVTYLIHEGRRVLAITEAPASAR